MAGDPEDLDVRIEELAGECGRLFMEGAKAVGLDRQTKQEEWFQRSGWIAVAGAIDGCTDGDYSVAQLAERIKATYLMAAGLPPEFGPAGREMALLWDAIVRFAAAAIMEGEIRGENSVESWVSWLRIKQSEATGV